MKQTDFLAVMAYLAAGCGKSLGEAALDVYWDLLHDLPIEALRLAAQRALLESRYPVMPPIGTLRQLATEAMAGRRANIDGAEAWGLVRRAVLDHGFYRPEEGLASLPTLVQQAVECLGWKEICDSTEAEIIRAQFRKVYDGLAEREQHERLLPAPLKEVLKQIGRDA